MSALKATNIEARATRIELMFSTLAITLRIAARLTPDSTMKFITHISAEAPVMAGQLLPPLKTGKK